MRNFYLTADIDGRQTMLTGGPRGKRGEMSVEIRQKDEGRSVVAYAIRCTERDGVLTTSIYDGNSVLIGEFTTNATSKEDKR